MFSDRFLEAVFSPLKRARERVDALRAENTAAVLALPERQALREKNTADSEKLIADAAAICASATATCASAAVTRAAALAAIAALYPQQSVITSFRDTSLKPTTSPAVVSASALASTMK